MQYKKIFIPFLFLIIVIFAGCEKNEVGSINGPANDNAVQSLDKFLILLRGTKSLCLKYPVTEQCQ
jgi:hypothetical protein